MIRLSCARLSLLVALLALAHAGFAKAGSVEPRDGWAVHDSDHGYAELLANTKAAIKAEGMFLVTEAGPTQAAANRGIDIPGNRVLGVFRNDYAVRVIRLSVPAMVEAPIRIYVTEDADGSATLSYKTPSHVFAPYLAEGGSKLKAVAEDLDRVFQRIAERALMAK